jgi:hypothetical protein
MAGKQTKNALNTDLANSDNETAEKNPETFLHAHLKNDILNRNHIIHMPFLEDVLNEDEEMLKKLNR